MNKSKKEKYMENLDRMKLATASIHVQDPLQSYLPEFKFNLTDAMSQLMRKLF